ncbi:MAG: type II/IV secretion system protein [Candidatus Ryanbacteria bacterium]|nr:type II/IV secretion system protein [Candidatus Ryanbacteria bacterium]
MRVTTEKLKELLVGPGLINKDVFDEAAKEATDGNRDLPALLIEKDLIRDDQLGRLIAEELGVPFANIFEEKIDEAVLTSIPELVARTRGVIAFAQDKDGVRIGMLDPKDIELIHFVEKRLGQKAKVYYITPRMLWEALAHYKAGLKDEFKKITARLNDQALTREERDEAIVRMVDALLLYGYESKASDIHIEPHPKKLLVRFRIDGVMHDVLEMPKDLHDLLLTRIKILSKMRTDEHRAAQDGKLTLETEEEKADVRISIVPVTAGENVVMRILSAKSRQFGLADLGLGERDLEHVNRALENPHGMILVTGPTGSGKTTTVYGMLKILNTRDVHIATIEDPVEYDIEGLSQIQVNLRTNLTFAKGLRAIVRQDPDIIMVGEIRDQETADIAVNSAMTGHLVLSTLHANDAATTLPRLLDMGVEPYLVASTVNIVIAQRLVRKICEKCRASHEITPEEKEMIARDPHVQAFFKTKYENLEKVRLYQGAGCSVCAHTGYLGRIGIFEVLEMTEEIKRLVSDRTPSGEIMLSARKNGMTTMMEDGLEKVFRGLTTLEEIIRATKE